MGKTNKGKVFERQWKTSADKQEIFILRLHDTSLSWEHQQTSRFVQENPCDFLIFYKGHLFPLELKSTKYKSISIQIDPEESAMIKLHQYSSLTNFNLFDGVEAGFIFNFREQDGDTVTDETTYWMAINDFNDFLVTTEKKSINKLDIVQHNGMIISERKIRTNYLYDIKGMLDNILQLSALKEL